MDNAILILNIVLSGIIVGLILMQNRGGGLGSAWGGAGSDSVPTRRGVELITFQITIVLVVIFFVINLVNLIL